MKILIDNGHGKNTPGKRSPDGKFREYLYAREIAEAIEGELKFLGLDAERIVTETEDISLASERDLRTIGRRERCACFHSLQRIEKRRMGQGSWLERLHKQGQYQER